MLSLTFFTLWLAVSAFASYHSQISRRHQNFAHRSVNSTLAQRGLTGASNAPLTYYTAGLGACGQTNTDNDFIVALNVQDFGSGYPGPFCHLTIVIQCNGKQARATIMDSCPGCSAHGPHGLDMAPALFQYFASESAGVLYATWWFDGGYDAAGNGPSQDIAQSTTSSTYEPTSTYVPPPTSTSTKTTYSETSTTTYTSTTSTSTSTSTTVESASSTTSKTFITSASATSTTSSTPTPSIPASSPSDAIESIFKAFIYINAMIALSS